MPDILEAKEAVLRRKMLGVKIRHARTRAELTPEEVGQILGVSAEMISAIELGQQHVSLPQLEVMALLFNVPVIYFWSDDPIEEPTLDFPAQDAISLRHRIIGVLLRQARQEAGRSREKVAYLLNIPVSRINDYESGQSEIPLQELELMADYLNVSLTYFMDKGLNPNDSAGQVASLEEIAQFSDLPKEVREFLTNPANLLYINIAMKLSDMSAETLRALAEGLLEVTY